MSNNLMLFLAVSVFLVAASTAQDFEEVWGRDYALAEGAILDYCEEFDQIAGENQMNRAEAMAVVFPEVLRYSLVRDLLETEFVAFGYVQHGKGFADFSIGAFQMKPSFVESLEQYVCSDPRLNRFTSLFSYSSADPKGIREERVNRLQSSADQLQYFSCFLSIAFLKYEELKHLPARDRVLVLAALYNAGFQHSIRELRKIAGLKIFPYGIAFGTDQYSYASISQDFYLRHTL